jgi:hypothetical protein
VNCAKKGTVYSLRVKIKIRSNRKREQKEKMKRKSQSNTEHAHNGTHNAPARKSTALITQRRDHTRTNIHEFQATTQPPSLA